MPSDEYFAAKGSLKLKGVDDSGMKKKKKKKKKDLERQMEANIRRETEAEVQKDVATSSSRSYTEAEKRFLERKRKMEAERILKKASLTHKEKVEEFNRHLDSLTEHFDIPKVSWTK
ncbi:protein FAM32A-like [Penaeus vannamei]|uniref:protein FAM32A-like n=1 Tax=Penaeus vannamei TaxID=6689 RepID=UPI00387FAEF1